MVVSTRSTNRALSPPKIFSPQKNCHPCKKAHRDVEFVCSKCKLAFCVKKLEEWYNLQKDPASEDWPCPRCLCICQCSQCRIFYWKNMISMPEDDNVIHISAEKKRLDYMELVGLRKENEECKLKLEMTERHLDILQGYIKVLRMDSESIKQEILKCKQNYSEELTEFGVKIQRQFVDDAERFNTISEENRKLYNEVEELKGNIRIYCRIRPFLKSQNQKETTVHYISDNGELVVKNPFVKESRRLFRFNKVFGPASTQEEVFLDMQPLIRSVLEGFRVCVFAYGQTGSGKTYTMMGPSGSAPEDRGVNFRALNDLFHLAHISRSFHYKISVQFVEIYNEQVRDLLSSNSSNQNLRITMSAQPNGLAVPEASIHHVTSTGDVVELMNHGLKNRAVGATASNEESSRSHSILMVHVCGEDLKKHVMLRGNLTLVDLAGSERLDKSEAVGPRLTETQNINKSLSALENVIVALGQNSNHVPYRNSTLTKVLEKSLGATSKVLMFLQLSPEVESFSETISSLRFAERVSGVELGQAQSNREVIGVELGRARRIKEGIGVLTVGRKNLFQKGGNMSKLSRPAPKTTSRLAAPSAAPSRLAEPSGSSAIKSPVRHLNLDL